MVKLVLKMIAHIGLVGFPNSGKSTLISKITNAKPKIGDYPFTTLHPNIGILPSDAGNFLIADIPGLIEGAHKGKGLGINFLRHIERTNLILFILDIADKPLDRYKILRSELESYSVALLNKEFMIALNKIDIMNDKRGINEIRSEFKNITGDTFLISALTGEGLGALKDALAIKFTAPVPAA